MDNRILLIFIFFASCSNDRFREIEHFPETKIEVQKIKRERGFFLINDSISMHTTFWKEPVISMDDYHEYSLYTNVRKGDTIWVSEDLNEVHVIRDTLKTVFKHNNIDSLKK